jgi:uncharacterized phage protein (TIGR01671 family)
MSRQIKFRAWDKQEQVLCPVKVINLEKGCFLLGNSPTPEQFIDDRSYVDEIPEGHFVAFEHLELMQFTGLQDKAGRDIYEGDIIAYDMESTRWLIEWREAGFYAIRPDTKEIHVFSEGWFAGAAIVIGNIYESPHLLSPKS